MRNSTITTGDTVHFTQEPNPTGIVTSTDDVSKTRVRSGGGGWNTGTGTSTVTTTMYNVSWTDGSKGRYYRSELVKV